MDISVKLRFFHSSQTKKGIFETSYENYMQQPHEIFNYLKDIEGLLQSETCNIKNKRFTNLFEYLATQQEQSSTFQQ